MQVLGSRILVAAFDGWNDAGEAATNAATTIRDAGAYEPVFSVDPELYFDYQYTRPTASLLPDGSRTLIWPGATLWRPTITTADEPELWLLTGAEPARAWQAFAAEVTDRALANDITGFVSLGSMMSDAPHSRDIVVHESSDSPVVRAAFDVPRSDYEGPVGVLAVLAEAMRQDGIPELSLWAGVPHYTAGHSPSPKAALALITTLAKTSGATIGCDVLRGEALRWEAAVDAAVADDDELGGYVRELETARDEWDSLRSAGDTIAAEFEQFLRQRGDGTVS